MDQPDANEAAASRLAKEDSPVSENRDGTGTTPGSPRRHDLDALRAFAMFLGIALHAALSFMPGIWPVQDIRQHESVKVLVAAVHGFRMPLFFILSGFFTAMLWRQRGLKALIGHRLRRIALPLLLCLFTVIPVVWVVTIAAAATGGKAGNSGNNATAEDPWTAAGRGDVALIEKLAAAETDFNRGDPANGATPLTIATLQGHADAVRALLAAGADPNARNRDGAGPLHAAAFLGHHEIVAQLLAGGADAQMKNHRGEIAANALRADWQTTEFIAKLIQVKVDRATVTAGREICAQLLAEAAPSTGEGAANEERSQPNWIAALGSPLFTFPVFHHLWFLWFLCWLVAGFSVFALLAGALGYRRAPKFLVASPLRYLWLIPLTMVPQWFMGRLLPTFGPDTSLGLLPMPHVLFYYAIFFGFGALYHDTDDREGRLGRGWWLSLPAGLLVLFPVGFELTMGGLGFADRLGDETRHRPLAVAIQAAYAWLMSCGLMGLFRRLLQRENFTVRYLSDSSYWLYIAHLPVVIGLAALMRHWELPIVVKLGFIVAVTSLALLAVYQFAIRYTWIGRLLNGPRTRREKAVKTG